MSPNDLPASHDPSPAEASHGSLDLSANGDLTVGGDVVGRDKHTHQTAGENIVNVAAGATLIFHSDAALRAEDDTPAPGESPYKGLQSFDEADADRFFGREALTARLVAQLKEQRLLIVVGDSGSGKSSLVRAGVIPALRRGEPLADGTHPPPDSARWPIHVITPTVDPLKELAASLTRDSESVTATAMLMDDLARDARSLDLAASRHLKKSGGQRVLLVVDQFEEAFTLCRDEAKRRAFVDNLMAATASGGPTTVVLTLRADFYAHCFAYTPLREALEQHQVTVGPMQPDELRRTIEEPAQRAGWELEPGLAEVLLRDVGAEPGALPLLSHALHETWKRRRRRTMTLRGYTESGGVRGAIARTADAVYSQLGPDQQAIARNIFLRLTELGEGTQDTRRRAALDELIPQGQTQPGIQAVLMTLADARLITTGEGTAEVAHEALIREWPALRGWLDENRAGLRLLHQMTESAQDWERLARDEGLLYRRARLIQAGAWADEHPDQLSALEREFLGASRALAEREEAEREANRRRELEAAQKLAEAETRRAEEQAQAARRLQLRNRITTVFGGLALVAAVTAGLFWAQANSTASRNATLAAENANVAAANNSIAKTAEAVGAEALQQSRVSQAQRLLAEAQLKFADDPLLSLRLAAEALAVIPPGDPSQATIVSGALALARQGRVDFLGDDVTGLYLNDDSSLMVVNREAGKNELLRTADFSLVSPITGGAIEQVVFSANPKSPQYLWVQYQGYYGRQELRSAVDGAVITATANTAGDSDWTAQFSPDPDAAYLGAVKFNGFYPILRTADGSLASSRATYAGPDTYLVSVGDGRAAELRSRADGATLQTLPGAVQEIFDSTAAEFPADYIAVPALLNYDYRYQSPTRSEYSGDSYLIITYTDGQASQLRRAKDGALVKTLSGKIFTAPSSASNFGAGGPTAPGVTFSPDRRYFLARYPDEGRRELIRAADGQVLVSIPEDDMVAGFNPGQTTTDFYYRGQDAAGLFVAATGAQVPLTGRLHDVVFSPDGSFLAIRYQDGPPVELRRTQDHAVVIVFGGDVQCGSWMRAPEHVVLPADVPTPRCFDDHARYLMLASADQVTTTLYRLNDGAPVAQFRNVVTWLFSSDPDAAYVLLSYDYKDIVAGRVELRRTADGALIGSYSNILDGAFLDAREPYARLMSPGTDQDVGNVAQLVRASTGDVVSTWDMRAVGLEAYVVPANKDYVWLHEQDQEGNVRELLYRAADFGHVASGIAVPGGDDLEYLALVNPDYDGETTLWRTPGMELVEALTGTMASLESLGPDVPLFLTTFSDGQPGQLRSVATGRVEIRLPGDVVQALAPSGAENFVVRYAAGADFELRRVADGARVDAFTLAGPPEGKIDLTFSPDPGLSYFVASYADGTMDLWTTRGGAHRLVALGLNVAQHLFDAQSRRLYFRYADGRTYVMDLTLLSGLPDGSSGDAADSLLSLLCQHVVAGRGFDERLLQPYLNGLAPQACPKGYQMP